MPDTATPPIRNLSPPRFRRAAPNSDSLSPQLPFVVPTGVDPDVSIHAFHRFVRSMVARQMWQTIIDKQLRDWLRDPHQLEDVGVDAPTTQIIRQAITLAQHFRDEGKPPPDSVVSDASGGIVFERQENGHSEVIHIWDDATAEYIFFNGTRIDSRIPLTMP